MDRITAAQVFVDVVHSGSFTATATRLAMSRPMVTRYVETMEAWFDVRLLHRTTRKVTLTSAGERCIKELENWLETTEKMINETRSSDELTGTVRLTSSISFAHAQLMSAISQFIAQYPKVMVDIDTEESEADLVKSRIDLAIRITSDPDISLNGKPIAKCRSILVASQDYLDKMPLINAPEDLKCHHCLSYTHFEQQVWHLSRAGEYQSVNIKGQLAANEATALLAAAIHGAGIALQPTYMANKAISEGKLVQVLPLWQPREMTIYALYSSRKFLSPTVRALIDFLEEYFKRNAWDTSDNSITSQVMDTE